MDYFCENGNIILKNPQNFDLSSTLDCGQAFRFYEKDGFFEGMAGSHFIKACQDDEKIIFYDMSADEFEGFFINYFDLNRDYSKIIEYLSADEVMKSATKFSGGIRILKQDFWETVCSFIISQNNNIPRIKGIIERLCENFGEKQKCGLYSYPSATKIASLTADDLAVLRAGFRTKYILDAANKIKNGEIDALKIEKSSAQIGKEELMKIKGIGDKVASCILLFSFGKFDALPKDVWIKRALNFYYGEEKFPDFIKDKGYDGIAQQYLFHYARLNSADIFKK
jgi:N-glycosylase/DNA lyase